MRALLQDYVVVASEPDVRQDLGLRQVLRQAPSAVRQLRDSRIESLRGRKRRDLFRHPVVICVRVSYEEKSEPARRFLFHDVVFPRSGFICDHYTIFQTRPQ